ncbi:MAG TPA: VWA domain-containing protein [Planctomycetota bacterium]|nr:VWA domain-containing protein [Planctomycetota bacterium]
MRTAFFLLCQLICAVLALSAEDADVPSIAARPLSTSDISRFSTRLRDADDAKAIQAAAELGATHQAAAAKMLLDFYQPAIGVRRMAAVKALGELGDRKQADALLNISLWDNLSSIRHQAVREIVRLDGNEAALKRFTDVALDAKRYPPVQRNRAVHFAAQIGGVRATPFLRDILNGKEIETAIAAAEELGELREPISVDALLAVLGSQNEELKHAAVYAIERLTGKNYGFDLIKWSEWRKSVAAPGNEILSADSSTLPGYKPPPADEKLPVDLVIAFDTTGSFTHAWADVDRALESVLREIATNEPSPRIGLIRYRAVDPTSTLRYTLWPSPLNWNYEAIRKELSVASFGGGSGAMHEALRYALNGMLWRERSRKVIVLIGDDTPYSPAEDAMKITLQLTRDAALLDGVQVNTLYTKTTAGEENRITYRRIAEAGIGRFYEYNKAERHLVDMSAEKVDVKKNELPAETEKKWLTPRK